MNINEASTFFKNLLSETNKKSERKLYENFLGILANLESRGMEEMQLQSIDEKLDNLDLNASTTNRKKYINKKLSEFTSFLKTEFSFTTEGHYTEQVMVFGMIFGSGIGVALGTAFGAGTGTAIGLSLGIGIGLAIGIAIGAAKDEEAKKEGRVLLTKKD